MHDTPDSTCFSSIGYDSSTGTLMVVFRDSGAKYAYGEVPKTVYNELRDAESMGGYYNKNIKGKYDCTKVE
ncbi:MAG: KTSC domain-containing protein [Oscillospiraceae bacterium]|nr:KTSC domain-containing protein [Oscillospiraceae bacterium]